MNVVGEGASSTLEFVIPMFVLEINACKNPIFLVDSTLMLTGINIFEEVKMSMCCVVF